MVKVRKQILNEIRGSVRQRITFRFLKTKARQVIQETPIPRYTRTQAQDNVRSGYQRLCHIWKTANWIDKTVYELFAKKYSLTTFNTFLKFNQCFMNKKPAAYWSFDEGEGTTLHDLTKNENHGSIVGASWQTLPSGKHVLSFDGVDDYVKIPDSPSLDLTELTIVAWLKTTQTGTPYFRVFSRRDTAGWDTNPYQFGFRSNLGTVLLVIGDGSIYNKVEGKTDIRDGKWHFIVGVVTGSELKVYVDGNLEATETQTITPFDYDGYAVIAKAGERFLQGQICLVTLFDKALTDEQIKTIYQITKVLFEE